MDEETRKGTSSVMGKCYGRLYLSFLFLATPIFQLIPWRWGCGIAGVIPQADRPSGRGWQDRMRVLSLLSCAQWMMMCWWHLVSTRKQRWLDRFYPPYIYLASAMWPVNLTIRHGGGMHPSQRPCLTVVGECSWQNAHASPNRRPPATTNAVKSSWLHLCAFQLAHSDIFSLAC